jgi:hypothetical protein
MAVAGGSGVTQILRGLEDRADVDLVHSEQMRTIGITAARVIDLIRDECNNIDTCQDLVEEIKLLDTLWHHCLRIERSARSLPAIGLASRESPHIRPKFAANTSLVLDSEKRLRLLIALRNTHSSGSRKQES